MIMDSESCTDAIQNQDEMGIDCGGTCPESCGMKLRYLYRTICKKNDTLSISFTSIHYLYSTGDILTNIAH